MAEEGDNLRNEPQYTVTVHDAPKFDLKSYISSYKGRTVFRRLYLIASCSTALREDAARMTLIEAKKGTDVENYRMATALVRSVLKAEEAEKLVDSAWVKEQGKKNEAETKRLENELKNYKNNLIRESIRMGNEDLGQHYHNTGDLANAVKAFSRMRDFCTTASHHASTAFRIIAVAIEQRNWLAVQSQVHKIRNLQIRDEDITRSHPKTTAAMGLQQMSLGDYKEAAKSFLNTDSNLGDSYNDALTSNDVAVYGGLCALASMSHSELQTQVLDNANFRNFLELEPHIRRAIAYFCASKYSQCLEILESYRADYLLDIYLQSQINHIYTAIRTKSIVQYFQPFSRVTLVSMEKMFGDHSTDTNTATSNSANELSSSSAISPGFRTELTNLIDSGLLSARIDTESQCLVANVPNLRAETQKQALDTVDRFINEARLKLLRLAAVNAGIEVKPPPKDKKSMGMDLAGMMDTNGAGGMKDGSKGQGNFQGNFQGAGFTLR